MRSVCVGESNTATGTKFMLKTEKKVIRPKISSDERNTHPNIVLSVGSIPVRKKKIFVEHFCVLFRRKFVFQNVLYRIIFVPT